MNDLKKIENELIDRIGDLREDMESIQQPRSDFALAQFVVAQHATPGRQRMQVVLELQIKLFNIRRAQLEERKLLVERRAHEKIARSRLFYRGGKRELAEIAIERIDTDLAEMALARKGNIREAQCLLVILDKLPKYTYEQLQAEEPIYWRVRLSKQALTDLKSTGTIGQGNVEAINQMYREVGDVVVHSLSDEQMKEIAKLGETTVSKRFTDLEIQSVE